MIYMCMNCKVFVYDEERGDAELNLAPGTRVDDIPDSYRCPVCGAIKCCLHPLMMRALLKVWIIRNPPKRI